MSERDTGIASCRLQIRRQLSPSAISKKHPTKIIQKLKELGLDPVRDREEAMKIAIHMTEACNTSLADYVFLPLEWEGERPILRWKDTWRL